MLYYVNSDFLPGHRAGHRQGETPTNRIPTGMQSAWQLVGSALIALLVLAFGATFNVPLAHAASNCNYYASPTGTGNGLSSATPFKIKSFWSVASPGKTLCLLDGTYRGLDSMIDPWQSALSFGTPRDLSGTSGNPITVRALNDGKVTIDGEGVRPPIRLRNNSWFVVEGVNAHHSGGSVVSVSAEAGHTATNNIIRRVVAWNAKDDSAVFLSNAPFPMLFEDIVAFGTGRKMVGIIGSQHFTCRRCWGRFEFSADPQPKIVFETVYRSNQVTYENAIGTWDIRSGSDLGQRQGIIGGGNTSKGLPNGNKILGSLAYVNTNTARPARLIHGGGFPGEELRDVVAYVQPGLHPDLPPFLLGGSGANRRMSDATSIGGGNNVISSGWTMRNLEKSNMAAGVNIFSNTPGVSGGASLCYRYINGNRTTDPLWPWPMNQRIIDAMKQTGKTPVDVTKTIEQLFGPIPNECRTDTQGSAQIPPPGNLRIVEISE